MLVAIAVFLVLVYAVAYLRFGILPNIYLGFAALAVIPVTALLTRSSEFVRDSVTAVMMLLIYEALDGITGTLVGTAGMYPLASLDNAIFGFNLVGAMQAALKSPLLTLVGIGFYTLHAPLVVLAMVLFWFSDRKVYRRYISSLVLVSFSALVVFALFPTAPPWLAGSAQNLLTLDSGSVLGPLYPLQQAFGVLQFDKYAAFPSLHMAYIVLFLINSLRLDRRLGIISVPIFAVVGFFTMYLGQHYFVDLLAGVALALACTLLVDALVDGPPSQLMSAGARFRKRHALPTESLPESVS